MSRRQANARYRARHKARWLALARKANARHKAKDPERHRRLGAVRTKRYRDRHPEVVMKQLEEQRKARDFISQLKENPCTDCGVRYPPYVMDWDHVRGEKKANVSDMRKRNTAMASILEEIAKCDLVCANCHRTRTYVRGL